MYKKKDIINILFVSSFPYFGLFSHYGRVFGPTKGIFLSLLPYLAIIGFHLIDTLYKRDFQTKVKGGMYWCMLAYIGSLTVALFVALSKGTPLVSTGVAVMGSLTYVIFFHAFIIVFLYNGDRSHEIVPRLTVMSIGILVLLSVVGFYGLGISTQETTFEEGARDNLPFFRGVWDAGAVVSILCLFVAWLIGRVEAKPLQTIGLVLLFLILFVILIRLNSRISILLLLLTLGLLAVKLAKSHFVYWFSLLTLPVILNSRYLLYAILSQPIFKPIMLRTDFEDIISLNGRTILWQRGVDWLLHDQRGLLLGLGHQGQYFISLLRDIQLLWHPTDPHIMHWHSATLEVLVDQGLVGLLLLVVILYKLFIYYRQEFKNKQEMGMFFTTVIFLLFNVEIDVFILFGGMGTLIFFLLVAGATVKTQQSKEAQVSNFAELEAVAR